MVPKELFRLAQRMYRKAEKELRKEVSRIARDYNLLAEQIYHQPITPEEQDLEMCMNDCIMATMPFFHEQRPALLADAKSRLDHLAEYS